MNFSICEQVLIESFLQVADRLIMDKDKHGFSLISAIDPGHETSWHGKVFLTFDIDWAHDEVIKDTFELVEKFGVPSTWFVTHATPMLEGLRRNLAVELGIHPNFNDILDGSSNKSSSLVLEECLSLVPNASSVRSHSLTQNERLVDQFGKVGLSHLSNFFVPYGSGIDLKPFSLWDELIVVPHFWQDNVALKMDLNWPASPDPTLGLQVFDFHPIHVFVPTPFSSIRCPVLNLFNLNFEFSS